MEFGLALVILVSSLQNGVMWGGLSTDTFKERLFSLSNLIINATEATCVAGCAKLDVGNVLDEISSLPQEIDAEFTNCFFQSILFILMIPFTLAMYGAKNKTQTGTSRV